MIAENRKLYIFLVSLLFLGLTLGTVPTSIPQFLLAGWWLITGNFRTKIKNVLSCPELMLMMALWMWHVVAMLWTEDQTTGWNDIRIKLPLLVVPLLMGSYAPPDYREFRRVFLFFLSGLMVNLLWSSLYMWKYNPVEPRVASRFMSHIRLGYFVMMAVIGLVYVVWNERKYFFSSIMILVFLLFAVYYLGLMSMVAVAFFCGLVLILWFYVMKRKSGYVRHYFLVLLLIKTGFIIYVIYFYFSLFSLKEDSYNRIIQDNIKLKHYPNLHLVENGYSACINVDEEFLIRAWNRDFPDKPINRCSSVYFGLLRYLASRGLPKDSSGYVRLTSLEKEWIGHGIGNYRYPDFSGMEKKMYEFLFSLHQFSARGFHSGSSVYMRFYYWKCAWKILRKNIFFGVGTGDVFSGMKNYFVSDHIPFEWQKRVHQEFLSIWAALGLPGICLFLAFLFYPLVVRKLHRSNLLFLMCWSAIFFSFFYEDTLETQTGVSFVAFFFVWVLLYALRKNKEAEDASTF